MQSKKKPGKEELEELRRILTQMGETDFSDIEFLELCEATRGYPWRTVRSRVNGARLYIEKNGTWTQPNYALPSEALEAGHPSWTKEQVDEAYDPVKNPSWPYA